jgi:hypothetical protein
MRETERLRSLQSQHSRFERTREVHPAIAQLNCLESGVPQGQAQAAENDRHASTNNAAAIAKSMAIIGNLLQAYGSVPSLK